MQHGTIVQNHAWNAVKLTLLKLDTNLSQKYLMLIFWKILFKKEKVIKTEVRIMQRIRTWSLRSEKVPTNFVREPYV